MARLLLAWELGGGLGHVQKLAPLGRTLRARGHEVTLGVRDPVAARHALAGLPFPAVVVPTWMHRTVGPRRPTASLADIVLDQGYADASALDALLGAWRGLLAITRADAVIGDYAPTGLLAARAAGLPSAGVGTWFVLPPRHAPLPALLDGGPDAEAARAAGEGRLLAAANGALARLDAPPLDGAWRLFAGDRSLICAWPALDGYGRSLAKGESWHGPMFDPAFGDAPTWPAGDGPAVFVYLKGGEVDPAGILRTLVEQGCRVCAYFPDVAAGKPAPWAHPRVVYVRGPVRLDLALAEASMCVCHAGAGTLAQALLAGVPLLMLPTQVEQHLNARCVIALGAGQRVVRQTPAAQVVERIAALVHGAEARAAARAFAREHRSMAPEAQVDGLCDAIEVMLG